MTYDTRWISDQLSKLDNWGVVMALQISGIGWFVIGVRDDDYSRMVQLGLMREYRR